MQTSDHYPNLFLKDYSSPKLALSVKREKYESSVVCTSGWPSTLVLTIGSPTASVGTSAHCPWRSVTMVPSTLSTRRASWRERVAGQDAFGCLGLSASRNLLQNRASHPTRCEILQAAGE